MLAERYQKMMKEGINSNEGCCMQGEPSDSASLRGARASVARALVFLGAAQRPMMVRLSFHIFHTHLPLHVISLDYLLSQIFCQNWEPEFQFWGLLNMSEQCPSSVSFHHIALACLKVLDIACTASLLSDAVVSPRSRCHIPSCYQAAHNGKAPDLHVFFSGSQV